MEEEKKAKKQTPLVRAALPALTGTTPRVPPAPSAALQGVGRRGRMVAQGLPNPEHGPWHLPASSLKNNPSIRSQFSDEHFLQRHSPITHPPGGAQGEAGNEVPEAETPSLQHGIIPQQKLVRSRSPCQPEPRGAAREGVMAAWSLLPSPSPPQQRPGSHNCRRRQVPGCTHKRKKHQLSPSPPFIPPQRAAPHIFHCG